VNKDLAAVFVGLTIILCILFGTMWAEITISTDKIISTCKESK
jgi:hypothetical protein